jgi:hypothetical protein
MAVPSEDLLQLEKIQSQLALDDPVLHATSKFTVAHLTFNAFKETWPLSSTSPHVQIGVRHEQLVHAFPTRGGGAIYTVASGSTPILNSVDTSCETLEDVDLVAPFDSVEEWKSELSGNLSREFRALLKYLFLLHVAAGARYKNLGLPVDVGDLKVALMMVHQSRQPKISPQSPGSVDASDVEFALGLTTTLLLSGPVMMTHDKPTTGAHVTDQPATPDVSPAASNSTQLDDQDVDQDSSSDATHEDQPSSTPASAFTLVPVLAHEDSGDELEGVDDAETRFVLDDTPDAPTTESGDDTEVPAGEPAFRGPVMGFFTVNGPDRTRSTRKQVVPVAEDLSETEPRHFVASNRKNFRYKAKPPDDRCTENAAKAIKFAEEQARFQPGTPASDDGTIGDDDETDIEVVDDFVPDENTHGSSPAALSEPSDAEAEAQDDADVDGEWNSRPRRECDQVLLHDAQGSPIERVVFQAAPRPPSQQQNAFNANHQGATGRRNGHRTGLSGNVRSMTVVPVVQNTGKAAARFMQNQDGHVGVIPPEAMSTGHFRMVADGKNNTTAWPGRMPLAQHILAERAARSQVQPDSVMLRGRNVRDYPDESLERYAAGRGPVDGNWMNDRIIAHAELKRRAAGDEREPRVIIHTQQTTLRPPPIQPQIQPPTEATRQPPVQGHTQSSVQAPL